VPAITGGNANWFSGPGTVKASCIRRPVFVRSMCLITEFIGQATRKGPNADFHGKAMRSVQDPSLGQSLLREADLLAQESTEKDRNYPSSGRSNGDIIGQMRFSPTRAVASVIVVGFCLLPQLCAQDAVPAEILQRTFLIRVGNLTGTAFTVEYKGAVYIVTARHVVAALPETMPMLSYGSTTHGKRSVLREKYSRRQPM